MSAWWIVGLRTLLSCQGRTRVINLTLVDTTGDASTLKDHLLKINRPNSFNEHPFFLCGAPVCRAYGNNRPNPFNEHPFFLCGAPVPRVVATTGQIPLMSTQFFCVALLCRAYGNNQPNPFNEHPFFLCGASVPRVYTTTYYLLLTTYYYDY